VVKGKMIISVNEGFSRQCDQEDGWQKVTKKWMLPWEGTAKLIVDCAFSPRGVQGWYYVTTKDRLSTQLVENWSSVETRQKLKWWRSRKECNLLCIGHHQTSKSKLIARRQLS
jgi:hypothetical protein